MKGTTFALEVTTYLLARMANSYARLRRFRNASFCHGAHVGERITVHFPERMGELIFRLWLQ